MTRPAALRTRTFVALGLLVALLLAGVASYYASSNPDGLEYVAEQAGFADTAEEHDAADGPLADYRVKGVDDDRLSGGLAGVAGALVVLLLAGGLSYGLRRRGPAGDRPAGEKTAGERTAGERTAGDGPDGSREVHEPALDQHADGRS